jgi:hypothetical protein
MHENTSLKSILLLAANPKSASSLRLHEEEREIKERLRLAGYGKVPINSTGATRPRDIQQTMLDFKPQVVHFSGHGAGQDGLVFEDVVGQEKLVGAEALANLFKLFSKRVECVVLNACYSAFQAEAIAQHIDYVIGMNQAIGDRAAIEFAVGFYAALGAGEPIEFAYELGCNAIQLEGIAEHLTPVLYKKDKSQLNYPEYTDISVPAFDNILVEKASNLFSKLQEVREVLLPHLVAIPITAYSHDSVHHAKETLSYLTELYSPVLKNGLTPEEVFVIGVFTQVHDVGMKPHGGYTLAQIYSHHTHKASEFVDKYLNNIPFKREIQALCLVHNKSLTQARTHFDGLENEEMRLSLILSMFRISDMLDVEIQPGPEAIKPIYTSDLMLRIDGKHRARCIAHLSIDTERRKIHISKDEYVEVADFIEWLNVFNSKFEDYNQTLSSVNFRYKVIPVMNSTF